MLSIQLDGLTSEQTQELLPDNLILLGYRGSIAHGMYVPSSDPNSIDDKDIMGVFIAPVEHYLGFGRDEHKEVFAGEWDAVYDYFPKEKRACGEHGQAAYKQHLHSTRRVREN